MIDFSLTEETDWGFCPTVVFKCLFLFTFLVQRFINGFTLLRISMFESLIVFSFENRFTNPE